MNFTRQPQLDLDHCERGYPAVWGAFFRAFGRILRYQYNPEHAMPKKGLVSRTLNDGNKGIFLIRGNAGFISLNAKTL